VPIVIDPIPGSVVSPAQTLVVRSDAIGPIPPGSFIQIDLFPVGSEQPCGGWTIPISSSVQNVKLSQEHHNRQTMFSSPPLNGAVTMKLTISSDSGVFDDGTVTGLTYNPVGLLPELLRELSVGSSGGLTDTQATQLEQTHASTFPTISMDAMLLEEISSGPQGGVVAAQLGAWIMGVIVRIANVPPEFHVNTADGDYWTRSLAVVRIYRGSDLWKRVPVHTSSKIITFVDEGLVAAVTSILPLQWLLQISVQVSFAEGVTGQVFLMSAP
jgi:hypothetical protein